MSRKRNISDEGSVQESAQKSKFVRDQELNDIRSLLNVTEGRRFLWRLLTQCGVYKQSFTGNSETFFLEGQRSVGLWALGDIMDAEPDAYLRMIKENRKGDESNV